MGKSFWDIFCGDDTEADLLAIFNPFSCINHAFVVFVDLLIIVISIYMLNCKSSSRSFRHAILQSSREFRWPLILRISSTTFNGVLGLVYLGIGVWLFTEKLIQKKTLLPLHDWLVLQLQGFTWLMLTSTLTFMRYKFSRSIAATICFITAFLYSTFLCLPSLWMAVVDKEVTAKTVLDILSFPGSILLISSAFHENDTVCSLYEPLQAEDRKSNDDDENLTPFAKAGMISKLTFWWLNPLMKKGREKPLEDDDIPKLRLADRANTLYSEFMELLLQKTQADNSSHSPHNLSTVVLWQWKPILVAGFFALAKVLAASTCPIFLRLFIKVAEGDETFKYEGYVLTGGLFLVKCIESFSERQWNFRMRLVGTQVRSTLSAAIYKKQLKVSSSAKFTSGEIVSLVTVDAYRLGEFHCWIHQVWTTPLQLCLAVLITYYCIGLAALAAVLVIILTVLGNSPVAKLQAKCQSKLMEKQDGLLQFMSVSLSAMKVVKLYAWDMHFKKIAQDFREDEYKWLNAVQMQKAYYSVLFWLAPVLVPIASFWTCYFLGITLTTSKVFTFLSTIRLIQEPVRVLPDLVGAFIDARVAFNRIKRFLEAPELQNPKSTITKVTEKQEGVEVHSVSVKAKGIAWDDGCTRPSLRNIDMAVSAGEKVAICGEVGAGKTTLLAAILGELPYLDGKVSPFPLHISVWIIHGFSQVSRHTCQVLFD